MRIASLLLGCVLAAPALAQQLPIPAFGSTFTSTLTRGFWFQAPVGFVITGLMVPNEALQPNQVVEVINLGAAPPAYPGTVVGTQLFYDNTTPAGTLINCAIPVAPGDYIGILGACNDTPSSANSYNSYATPAGPFASSILGQPVTLTRLLTQSGIASNGGNQPVSDEAAGSLARVEVYIGAAGGYASKLLYGTGCYDTYNSYYEHFLTTPSIDLSNSAFRMLNLGQGYLTLSSTAAFVAPSATATNLGLTDDSEATVTLSAPMPHPGGPITSLNVCSNGHISTASNGAAFDYTPTPGELLNWANATWAVWRDMIPGPTGGGDVWFEEIGGVAYITWLNVVGYVGTAPGTTPSTFQLQFEIATGNVDFVFQSMDTVSISGWAGGEGWVVGYSPGGPSSSSTPAVDLSTAAPATFLVPHAELLALRHDATARPVIGTNIALETTNVPANCALGATLFGLTEINPGLDLTGLGMPGCFQFVTIDASQIWFPVQGVGSTPFSLPNNPAFAGVELKTQGVALVPGANTLGAQSSNGMKLTLDLL